MRWSCRSIAHLLRDLALALEHQATLANLCLAPARPGS